ncbi:molecular chaperone TorD [Oceanisphaera sp. IT1-181]|uniref:molecular chaperone TorD n=1 Tax=Oceanisphaera sp. IT1-181 TaxID=3081199 RepID=UPI0029CA5428|nr:molecular chaperone TorD [Oceanisphaera sp. IT1-181]
MTLQDATDTTAAPQLSPEQQLAGEYYQHQALICQWFATLLAKELDETALKAYMSGEAAPLLEDLEGISELAKPVQQLSQAISTLHLLEQPKLELAADFASLFLSDARHSPAPYASLYLDEGRFSGPSLQRMQARLAAIGMVVSAQLTEPADHVSIMLDYLAEGYRQLAEHPTPAAEATVANFVQDELASWLPEWANRGQKIDTASQFYPALLSLIAAYFAD